MALIVAPAIEPEQYLQVLFWLRCVSESVCRRGLGSLEDPDARRPPA
jgi:hypothetical protein